MSLFLSLASVFWFICMCVGVFVVVSWIVDQFTGRPPKQEEEFYYVQQFQLDEKHVQHYDPTAPEDEHPIIQLQNFKRRKGIGDGK